jgi:competence protein ComEC
MADDSAGMAARYRGEEDLSRPRRGPAPLVMGATRALAAAVALVLGVGSGGAATAGPQPAPGLLSGPHPAGGLQIYWVDVEGGAATLIVTPAGESILVDTGWPGERDAARIARAAADAGVTRIDHLVTTHWHVDHFGGIEALAARLPIGRFYDHGFPAGAHPDITPALKDAYLRVTGGHSTVLRPGDTLSLRQTAGAPAVSARVVASDGLVMGEAAGSPQTRPCSRDGHAARPDDESDNFRSVGMVVRFGRFGFGDLGDLTWNVEHKLVCPRNLLGRVDVYQVTHHGLEISNHPALIAAAAPSLAVINNGPRKGGSAAVYERLRHAPRPPDILQLHRNLETGPGDNAPSAAIANEEEACPGRWIYLSVDPRARRYTVQLEGKGAPRVYTVR